jgi:hypothetical protein
MASPSRRISTSSLHSRRSASPASIRFVAAPNAESEEWLRIWESTTAQGTCMIIKPPRTLHRQSLRREQLYTNKTYPPHSPGRKPGSCGGE